jgi:hypothetical protein
MQKLRIKIMNLLYHHLGLANVSVHTVEVHRLLAQLVLLRHSSKVLGRSPPVESFPGLRIVNQPIDRLVKVLVLGQIDLFHLCGLHLLLQHLRVVCGNRYIVDVLEGIIDHLLCSNIEHRIGFNLANSIGQMKMFLYAKEN